MNSLSSKINYRNLNYTGTLIIQCGISTKVQQKKYCQAISDAEKIVGVPTSFLSLKYLFNDEVADIASHIRKLMGTGHPLINTAKDLIMKKDGLPKWGLIILLLSKCQNINSQLEITTDLSEGILPQQRTLAEVTEMVRTSNILHNCIINHNKNDFRDEVIYGNKLALLTGDFLLSSSFKLLAEMRNQEVNELISTALRDLNESNFIEPRNMQNKAIPMRPLKGHCDNEVPVEFSTNPYRIDNYLGYAKNEWIIRSLLGGATLLAKSCESSMLLSGNDRYRTDAHIFGRNMGLAYQASVELKLFEVEDSPFELTCAPILFHIQYNPNFYNELIKDLEVVDYKRIRSEIKIGPGIQETAKLKRIFSDEALVALQNFPASKARDALVNIIETM